uniref:FAM234A/B beta-propeller domain-containing protein n=1 Tax=Leptobrachium leishanense TaxID=445787 RepID=A0A8C5QQA3_9ANUR
MDNKDTDAEIHPLRSHDVKPVVNNEIVGDKNETYKKPNWLSRCRTAAFFASLFLCLIVVFAFSFIIPCPVRPYSQRTWIVQYNRARTYAFLAKEDVNQDNIQDMLFLIKVYAKDDLNVTCEDEGFQSPCFLLTALSGTNGSTLWSRFVAEDVQFVECGIHNLGGLESSCCIIVGIPDSVIAIDSQTGNVLWQNSTGFPSNAVFRNPLLKIPDVNGDDVQDLMIFVSLGAQLQSFILSGKDGECIGQNKSIGIASKDGHYIHSTVTGSHYVLMYAGSTMEAYSVRDLFSRSTNEESNPITLQTDPDWEGHTNLSTGYIPIVPISSSGDVRYLMKVPGKYYNNILVVKSEVSELLDGQTFHSLWSVNTTNILSKPALGNFKKDVLSIMMEVGSGNGRKKMEPRTNLYLFHPSYSKALLQLNNHTDDIVMFDAFLFEKSRHACYVLLTGPNSTSTFGTVSISKRKLKEDITSSKIVWLSKETASEKDIRDHFFRMRYSSHS